LTEATGVPKSHKMRSAEGRANRLWAYVLIYWN
jgi:hypothetical protein